MTALFDFEALYQIAGASQRLIFLFRGIQLDILRKSRKNNNKA